MQGRTRLAALALMAAFSTTAAAQEVLRIGSVSPLTGPGAAWGLAIEGGARIAADQVNAKGGLEVAGKKYKVEVVSYDDEYKTASTVTAVNRLIERDGVNFIIGPLGAASLLAVKGIADKNKVLLMTNTYTVKALENTQFVFRVLPTSREFVPPFVKWLKENRPAIRKVALIAPNDETGWDSQKVQAEAYKQNGFDVVASELFERSQTDFRAMLTKLLAASPDSIELDTAPPPTAGLLIRQARELGFKGQFTKFGGVNVNDMVKAAGAENVEGTLGYFAGDPNGKEWKWLEEQYAKFHQNQMGDFTFFFYDATKLLLESIAKAGSVTDTAAVRTEIEKASPFETLLGKSVWGGKSTYGVNRQLFTPVFLGEIVGGKGQVITKLEAQPK